MATISDLNKAFKLLSKTLIFAIILTGSAKSFCSRSDISEFANFHRRRIPTCSRRSRKLFDFIENLKTPVIAA
jgi:enoyl-CoA hydratase/carnithine racemase